MVDIDVDELVGIAKTIYVAQIGADMGDEGIAMLKSLLPVIRSVHLAVSTERISKGLVVICPADGDPTCLPGPAQVFADASALTARFDGTTPLTVQMSSSGLKVWTDEFNELPSWGFLGYRYSIGHTETFFSLTGTYSAPTLTSTPTYFGEPYFRELRKALERYGTSWVKNSTCEIFRKAWLDDSRNVFAPSPEVWMRRSLVAHLRSRFREHTSIMPEQNVSETRPVDVKVTWGKFNRVALIEIKWLGKSARTGDSQTTQNFSAARAREGSRQLATYLNLYHVESPDEEARGYLVVYDARRWRLGLPSTSLSSVDATHYRNEDLPYEDAVLKRPDFEYPLRFFCEPA
jgi:hypothetical protein